MSKISRKGKKHEREGERETHREVDKQVSGITFGGDSAVLTDGKVSLYAMVAVVGVWGPIH